MSKANSNTVKLWGDKIENMNLKDVPGKNATWKLKITKGGIRLNKSILGYFEVRVL